MAKKASHNESADQLIRSIEEVLSRATGEEIVEAAKAVGLNVEYLGDSMFKVYEE